jgi:CRP-like cAMP-binding protein
MLKVVCLFRGQPIAVHDVKRIAGLSVFAVRDCELSFVSRKDFEEYTRQRPEICNYLVTVLASRLREADETLATASFLTVKARLARALLELAELLGEERGSGRILRATLRRWQGSRSKT